MAYSGSKKHKDSGSSTSSRYFAYLSLSAIVFCIVARAPTIFEEGHIPLIDLKLKLNAGYVLVFGPLLIMCAIAAILYFTGGTSHRTSRRPSADALVRVIPCLAAAFLSLQFFLLLAPAGQCASFPRWRYLTDWTLTAFKPEYCMSLSPETQERMPWLFDPPIVQAWGQVLLPLIAIGLVIKEWAIFAYSREHELR